MLIVVYRLDYSSHILTQATICNLEPMPLQLLGDVYNLISYYYIVVLLLTNNRCSYDVDISRLQLVVHFGNSSSIYYSSIHMYMGNVEVSFCYSIIKYKVNDQISIIKCTIACSQLGCDKFLLCHPKPSLIDMMC